MGHSAHPREPRGGAGSLGSHCSALGSRVVWNPILALGSLSAASCGVRSSPARSLYYGKVISHTPTMPCYRSPARSGSPARSAIIREVVTLTEVQRLSRRLTTAEARASELRAERDAAIVAAHSKGESPRLIALAAGLSEQAVFKILRAAKRKGVR
jgi:hypothetical protein